jgi:23S rRNA (uracil1939-C5)-methyltransferase
VIDIRDCVLTSDALRSAPDLARALAGVGASRKGEIGVQVTETLDGLDVMVTGGKPLDQALQQALPEIMHRFGLARLMWDDELVAQAATPRHRIGRADVFLPAGAFLQATAHGEASLQACVREALGQSGRVVDLFAGCGTFALDLADIRPVHAVEGESRMTMALQEAANRGGLTYPVTTETRDLFRNPLLPDELARFDAVVLDPPRAGAAAQVAQIAKARPSCIAYVSCDAGSFARDVAELVAAGYRLDWVQPVDQFRWSPHVELAARLSLPHMTG